MTDHMSSMDKTLVTQSVQLTEHIRRTNLLENQVKNLDEDIEPIKNHVAAVNGAGRILKNSLIVISVSLGIVLTTLKLLGKI